MAVVEVLEQREGDVEVLVEVVHVVELLHRLDVALREGGPGKGLQLSLKGQVGRDPVDDLPVLGLDGVQVLVSEDVFDDQVAVLVEPVEFLRREPGHPFISPPAAQA